VTFIAASYGFFAKNFAYSNLFKNGIKMSVVGQKRFRQFIIVNPDLDGDGDTKVHQFLDSCATPSEEKLTVFY
jgi:hypothetical protein